MNEKTQSPENQLFCKLVFPPDIIDGEKIMYAIKGTAKNVNVLRQQYKDNELRDRIMSLIIDSREKYNLNNAEAIQVALVLIDRFTGIPADIISPVINNNDLLIDETFKTDTKVLKDKLIARYTEIFGTNVLNPKGVNPQILTGFGKIVELAMNETGCSYKAVIALCMDYIHAQEELVDEYLKHKKKKQDKKNNKNKKKNRNDNNDRHSGIEVII